MQLTTSKELLETLDKIVGTPILVVGDLMLDRYIWGKVSRISQEAPVPVVDVGRTEDRLGGAGNVVRNLCSLGMNVSVCGLVGHDAEGVVVQTLLQEAKVSIEGVVTEAARPTTLKTRVIAHHQQVVRIDREDFSATTFSLATESSLQAFIEKSIPTHKGIIVSDYGKGAISDGVLTTLERACDDGRLGLKLCPLLVDPHPKNYGRYRRMSVAKPNRGEAEIASGIKIDSVDHAFEAAHKLMQMWHSDMMVVSLGEDGLVVVDQSPSGLHLETHAKEVFDVSGAGDTVSALFAAALAVGSSPTVAGVLANIGAGIVISEVGTVAVNPEKLRSEIRKLGW